MRNFAIFAFFAVGMAPIVNFVVGNTECVWATGRILCHKNQTKVIGSIVELWDLDSPRNSSFKNPVDPDDKAGFTVVDDPMGLFAVEGCATDFDWVVHLNRPEFYLKVTHNCNSATGEKLTILPVFQVFTPNTYDYHIEHPIELD